MVRRGILAILWITLVGCADESGTIVAMTLVQNVADHDEGYHYELFATINGGVVSLKTFEIRVAAFDSDQSFRREIVCHQDPSQVLGVVDGIDQFLRPIGGIRLRVDADLRHATGLFITREQNGDTDPAPSTEVFLTCTLSPKGSGTLGCILSPPTDKAFIQGTVAVVPSSEGINPL